MINKKELIIKFLKEEGMLSTGKIANRIKANQFKTEELLEELIKEKKVVKNKTPNATYWRLK